MRYRGRMTGGVVVLEGDRPPEGTVVEITPASTGPSIADDPAIGIWKDRSDLPADPAAAASVLADKLRSSYRA